MQKSQARIIPWCSRTPARFQCALFSVLLLFALICFMPQVVAVTGPAPLASEFFERSIRPFLANDCYECHGPSRQKGGLRLDSRQGLLQGGESGPAIVPGQSDQSLLIQAIKHSHDKLKMPKDRPAWPAAVIAQFESWIQNGAPDPRDKPLETWEPRGDHPGWSQIVAARKQWWSFQPLGSPAIPAVKNQSWPQSNADRFILSQLEKAGLTPAPAAPPHAWLRRVSLALTGLPPQTDTLQSFLNNPSPEAKAQIVDQLLDSPHYGERWARHWMDLVRYAESYGHEQDYPIHNAWQYRDYLIRAFNADVSYDQFLREHLAGDLLHPPRTHPQLGFNESVIATGFWYMHQATHAPVDPNQDEADRIDNQIDVVSKTFLGLTVGCARCHDHKFDPISMNDYYGMSAHLRSSRQDQPFLGHDAVTQKCIEQIHTRNQEDLPPLIRGIRHELAEGRPAIASYFKATQEVVNGKPQPQDYPPGIRPDIVIDDFEDGTYNRWLIEGEAFGHEPASGNRAGQNGVESFQGTRLANSFHQGDSSKGILQSHPFTITRHYLRFLLGGGIPSGSARIVLKSGDQEIHRSSGKNRERLEAVTWDVRMWEGQEVTLELIDDESATWGHILVDQIVLSDLESPTPFARPISIVAQEFHVDPVILERWTREWSSPHVKNTQHPWHPWKYNHALSPTPSVPLPATTTPTNLHVHPFEPIQPQNWFVSGFAFQNTPLRSKTPRWTWTGDQIEFIPPSTLFHSGEEARHLTGTIRSPSFVVNHENIHILLSGQASHIRLVISRYALRDFNGLLFERTHLDANTDGRLEWKSMSQDLKRHIGRTAYLEIVDPGPGAIRVDRIVLSNDPNPPNTPSPLETTNPSSARSPESMEKEVHDSLQDWLQSRPDSVSRNPSWPLLSWMSQKGLLDWGELRSVIEPLSSRAAVFDSNLPPTFRVLAMTAGTPEVTQVMQRGNPKQLGAQVAPSFIQVLSADADLHPTRPATRLDWADQFLNHPAALADRVIVNRIWAHLFGRGIVPTVDNFGSMGVKPTHPELLDHLVQQFRHQHRSIKKLIRELVLSSTYAMSSSIQDPEAEIQDPDNSLLHRQRLTRLEGEIIRDQWLAVSDRLDPKLHGNSIPTHFTPFMGDRMWVRNDNGPLDGHGRRSIYLESRRNFLSPFMLMFDLPIPDSTVGRRNSSNVPGQALALMNDPLVQQLSRTWATNLLQSTPATPQSRIQSMFLKALSRPPSTHESQQFLDLLAQLSEEQPQSAQPAESQIEVWSQLCHVLFMMKEMIHVP